jgi:hypothetical protein
LDDTKQVFNNQLVDVRDMLAQLTTQHEK